MDITGTGAMDILSIIMSDEMGADAWDKTLDVLGDDLADNVAFLQKILKNEEIIKVGRELQQKLDEGNIILAEISERRLASLVMEMITADKNEELRGVWDYVMKDIELD